jgi:antitoxin (DNA-binding transcriptional repressor) of toxin-antitoxin stability system
MIATESATRYNREPSKLLAQAERGQTVLVEKHGAAVAALVPMPRLTSGAAIARRMEHLTPAPQAAHAVEKLIQGMNHAGQSHFD